MIDHLNGNLNENANAQTASQSRGSTAVTLIGITHHKGKLLVHLRDTWSITSKASDLQRFNRFPANVADGIELWVTGWNANKEQRDRYGTVRHEETVWGKLRLYEWDDAVADAFRRGTK